MPPGFEPGAFDFEPPTLPSELPCLGDLQSSFISVLFSLTSKTYYGGDPKIGHVRISNGRQTIVGILNGPVA